ncbi:MAG: hypothetical protein MK160_00185 [Rhodobacteraceae bacterium]|nr:hypothetical protein [Paracoccaceae bacterium]
MRPVLHGDLTVAARALLAAPAETRRDLVDRIIEDANAAHQHLFQTGRVHPVWGTGSLMTSARRFDLAHEPRLDDPDYASCLITVLQRITAYRAA